MVQYSLGVLCGEQGRLMLANLLDIVKLSDCSGGRTASVQLPGLGSRGDRPPAGVIEAALAHAVRNRVEAAYARSDLFERRRLLMDD